MKKVYIKAGIDSVITNEMYNDLINAKKNNDYSKLLDLIEHMVKYGKLSGETYIVASDNIGVEGYDSPDEEISVEY